MLVVDASVLVVALADDGSDGDLARYRLRGEDIAAPELADLEIAAVLRKQCGSGAISVARAERALDDLADLPLRRTPHLPLLARCWELRENLTIYEAAYVALAEALDVSLLTADLRLASATGPTCVLELIRQLRCPRTRGRSQLCGWRQIATARQNAQRMPSRVV